MPISQPIAFLPPKQNWLAFGVFISDRQRNKGYRLAPTFCFSSICKKKSYFFG
jgi:hypothetical protein